jgi:hypothetical protein
VVGGPRPGGRARSWGLAVVRPVGHAREAAGGLLVLRRWKRKEEST